MDCILHLVDCWKPEGRIVNYFIITNSMTCPTVASIFRWPFLFSTVHPFLANLCRQVLALARNGSSYLLEKKMLKPIKGTTYTAQPFMSNFIPSSTWWWWKWYSVLIWKKQKWTKSTIYAALSSKCKGTKVGIKSVTTAKIKPETQLHGQHIH